jgi:hypothetical protein
MVLRIDESWNLIETNPDHQGRYTEIDLKQQVERLRCPACDGPVDIRRTVMSTPLIDETTYGPGPWKCPQGCQPKRP